jgi:hypothetical protein
MRFSLRWLLAAAVYVAVAAAALSQKPALYGEILWGMTLLALSFAALLAIFMRGEGRIIATGFVLAGASFLGHAMIALTYSSASARVLMAVGYDPSGMAFPITAAIDSTPAPADSASGDTFSADIFGSAAVQPTLQGVTVVSLEQYIRAGNAIGAVLMGLLGASVGMVAARVVAASEKAGNASALSLESE